MSEPPKTALIVRKDIGVKIARMAEDMMYQIIIMLVYYYEIIFRLN